MEDLRVLFFLHIVEAFLMTITGLRLFGYKGNIKIYLSIGLIHGIIVWSVRGVYLHYHIPFGTHTLILLAIYYLLVKTISKVSWGTALGAALVSFSLVLIGGVVSGVLVQSLHLNMGDIVNNPWLHVLVGYSENVFLVLLLIVNVIYGFTLNTVDSSV